MEILSINVSPPVAIQYQGKTLSTGIFKKPVTGEVWVGKNNIAGDQQVDLENHGGEHKAVYAFSAEHYSYWRRKLARPDLSYGAFGENITVSEFGEEGLHIGDQFRMGECILEISQPRVPCFKLGIALDNKSMPQLFIKSFATGVYLRVIQEGYIQAGAPIALIKTGKYELSVRCLFQAYFDKSYPDALNIMKKALLIPELSPEWVSKLSEKISKGSEGAK
jgi:MOSC domain-containing protein YiiM